VLCVRLAPPKTALSIRIPYQEKTIFFNKL